MGKGHIRARHYIFICTASLICISILGCSAIRENNEKQSMQKALVNSRMLMKEGDFMGSLRNNREVLSHPYNGTFKSQALFNIALIYAHYENPDRDYSQALIHLEQLINEYPHSPLLLEAQTWAHTLKNIDELQDKLDLKTISSYQVIKGRQLIAEGNFKEAVVSNEKLLSHSTDSSLKEEALFSIGLIYAHYNNPDRDYLKSVHYFTRLTNEYSLSTLAEEATIWTDVLTVIEKAKQVDIEIENKKKEMAR